MRGSNPGAPPKLRWAARCQSLRWAPAASNGGRQARDPVCRRTGGPAAGEPAALPAVDPLSANGRPAPANGIFSMAPILAEGAAPAEDSEEFPEPSFSERPFPFPFPLFPLPLPLISSSYLFPLPTVFPPSPSDATPRRSARGHNCDIPATLLRPCASRLPPRQPTILKDRRP